MSDRAQLDYYGQFTLGTDAFCLEGSPADDCLHVSKLISPTEVAPICTITGRDRNHSHELLISSGEDMPQDHRRKLIFAAVNAYRMWLVDGPRASGDGCDE